MAIDMKRIYGTNNAFEYSETVDSVLDAGGITSEEIFIPSNVASLTMGIKRAGSTGDRKFRVEVTFSTKQEVQEGTAKWFTWDIPGTDVDGLLDEDEIQWWVPVPGSIRLFVEGGATGTEVYWSMRAN